MMMIENPLSKKRYYIAIRFKNEKRAPIDALMQISEYRRMVRDFQQGLAFGCYRMNLDNIDSELTFPLQEIDTIHAAPEVMDEPSNKIN